MTRVFWLMAFLTVALTGGLAQAQDTWVQIEAQPSLAEAEGRARAYAGVFANVNGFTLDSGWYGIAIGPYTPEEAQRQLDLLRGERLIPADSYIAESGELGRRFWPVGLDAGGTAAAGAGTGATSDQTASATQPATEPALAAPDQTPEDPRASEAALSAEDRQDLQRAMQFVGVYSGKIDGSFGPGTRAAMAAWQAQNTFEPTGILTTAQRQSLVAGWKAERAAMGIEPVTEAEAGIDIDLPLGMVEFDRYDPPFVRYKAKGGSGFEILLISRQGDATTLAALYDHLQSLAIMPLTGARSLAKSSFILNGVGDKVQSYAQADLSGGLVKGFVLVWPLTDQTRASRILEVMKATFVPQGTEALDENLGEPSQTPTEDLVSGLEIRRPTISRSGVFIDAAGSVLTTTEVLKDCDRITLDGLHPADVALRNESLGFAVLKPQAALAPPAIAEMRVTLPRLNSDVALGGYSYEDTLDAPVVSFGTFAEGSGLNGEDSLARLTIKGLPGDVGGPVLDASGAMLGMLLPRVPVDGRDLPADVSFALKGAAITAALSAQGMVTVPSTRSGTLATEDLAALARSMTVLVSCWK